MADPHETTMPTERDALAELIATIAVQVVAGFVEPKAMIPALRAWQATFPDAMTPEIRNPEPRH